jgi:hypothetical protein
MKRVKKTAGIGKGTPGPGRPKGMPNKSTKLVKEALQEAFEQLGGVPSLLRWATRNRDEFYKLWARLIPSEVHLSGEDGGALVVRVKDLTGTKRDE